MSSMPRFQTTDRAQNAGWTFRQLLGDLRKYWVPILFVIICALFSCTLYILVPSLLSSFTDNFISDLTNLNSVGEYTANYIYANEEGVIALNTSSFVIEFVLLVGCYLGTAALNWATTMLDIQFTTQYGYDIRKRLKEKLDKVPLKYYDDHITGDILSTVSNDVGNVSQELGDIIRQVISAVMMTIGVLIAMFIESWQLTLVALATLPFSITIAWLIARQSQKHFQKYQDRLGDIEGHAEEYYSGFSVIKLFNKEEDTALEFNKYNKDMMDADYKSRFYSSLIFPCIRIVNNIGYVFVAVIGGLYGSVGNIVSFIMYLQMFTQPIQNLGELSSIIQQTLASAERVYTLLNENEESPDPEGAINDPNSIKGSLTFNHVDFSYDPDKPLITDMNLNIKEGQSVAIVGPTGAGKTTIVNLIMRFYDVNYGEINLDGTNINNYTRSNLRKSVGMVLQDTWLFDGTIRDNIRYGREDASDQEVEEAAKAAMADHFISLLPGGYDFRLVENGSNISQGQRQLITIARAIISLPKILILDEATSSVDTRTEKIIQDVMNKIMENRTSFIIAHRLSTIKNAKTIIVMNKGQVVEIGNHEELLAKGGFYADLYNSQFTSGINPMDQVEVIEDIKT